MKVVAKSLYFSAILVLVTVLVFIGYRHFDETAEATAGLRAVANGDAQFWLMQGAPNDRFIPCTVYYQFDRPLDEAVVLARLTTLAASYKMFRRNIVELDGLPYWQQVEPDWNENFRVLDANDDIESIRAAADVQLSLPSTPDEGIPLFRAYLSADRRQLVFMWHHVISDLEGMFNKHARHLFMEEGERTTFGYQLLAGSKSGHGTRTDFSGWPMYTERPLGFTGTGFEVTKLLLPVEDKVLHALGKQAGLPMSDIFSFITLRAVTRYHQRDGNSVVDAVRPVLSPLSLRKNSLATDEGNNRATRQFPVVLPLESVGDMYHRIIALAPSSSSYETAGKAMKLARRLPFLEPVLRKLTMPDYISNYFPLADFALGIDDAKLVSHDLRVPMVPYERSKFAWSNYNGEVQLYLHTDPVLMDTERMITSYRQASAEVLQYLSGYTP